MKGSLQDLLPFGSGGRLQAEHAVEASRAKQGRVENVRPVGGRHHDQALVLLEPVHQHEELVQRLLAFLVHRAETGSAASADGVQLVDEDDGRLLCRCFFKRVPHAGRPHTDKHLDELRCGRVEER